MTLKVTPRRPLGEGQLAAEFSPSRAKVQVAKSRATHTETEDGLVERAGKEARWGRVVREARAVILRGGPS